MAGKTNIKGELAKVVRDERGQGTTEYAILVGVLVVIAIVAIIAFRGRVAELWQAISDGINSL
ncbi:MAG: class III signal peptide-containing protein [Atopobiaceae bacterium]|nr:class III signal peptide-containing protein [Atopobiaceae bacterium]